MKFVRKTRVAVSEIWEWSFDTKVAAGVQVSSSNLGIETAIPTSAVNEIVCILLPLLVVVVFRWRWVFSRRIVEHCSVLHSGSWYYLYDSQFRGDLEEGGSLGRAPRFCTKWIQSMWPKT